MQENQKRKLLKKTEELSKKIDEMADLIDPDDIEVVNYMKQEVQNLQDERELAIARKCFVKMQIEGEKPTQYFCKMNKKIQAKAQFEEILLEEFDKNGKEVTKVIKDQDEIEKEVLGGF